MIEYKDDLVAEGTPADHVLASYLGHSILSVNVANYKHHDPRNPSPPKESTETPPGFWIYKKPAKSAQRDQ